MDSSNNRSDGEEQTESSNQFCMECGYTPCIVLQEYNNITEIGETHEEMGKSNNEIRFALYGYMSKALYGYLGKGNRRKLPGCVIREVHDSYPEKDGETYTGFRERMSSPIWSLMLA
jgi:hypothetical protein